MKKVLGLDLGVTSIGWAYILENENKSEILGLGSRIIPLDADEKDEFNRGNKISKNQQRTLKRSLRKGYDRYQLRKKYLREELEKNSMLPAPKYFALSALEVYGLREMAIHEDQVVGLEELGRIFLHLNQKRGYKSSKKELASEDKATEYEQEINGRYDEILSEKE